MGHATPLPRLTVDTSSPPLRSSSFFNDSSLPDLLPPPRPPPSPSSRNNLFDQDWSPITPNLRSRSSTAESRFSSDSKSSAPSTVSAASSRKSWMDIGRGDHTVKCLPTFDKTPVPISGHSRNSSEFDWPLTPPPSEPFHSRHTSLPVFNLPPSPPSPPQSDRFSFSPRPTLPSSPSTATILPSTAGHSSNPLLDTRQAPSLRMSATSPYLLGEGRHASVYLASFTPRSSISSPRSPERQLCAAKRLFPDRDSQLSGLGEAFILSKLTSPVTTSPSSPPIPLLERRKSNDELAERGAKHILRLWGVKDERDGLELPAKGLLERSDSRRSSKRYSEGYAGSPLRGEEVVDSNKLFPTSSNRSKGPRHSEPIPVPTRSSHASPSRLLSSLAPPLTSSSAQRRRTQSANSTPPPPPAVLPPPTPPSDEPRIDLILEFCPYGNLLQFARNQPERMDKKRWFDWSRELVSAVAWSHERNVLHADLKPQNIMIAKDLSTRLCDFGMSLFLPPPDSPRSSFPTDPHGLGTPSYSPPEFVKPLPSTFSYPSDIFSLGVTLCVMITGREPYEGVRSLERMLRVGEGGWWEWEERRRLKEMEGEEVEVEEGGSLYNLSLGDDGLSRKGSMRSMRSVRTLSRRSGSSESLRSLASLGGTRDWEKIARSLLLEDNGKEEEEDTSTPALEQFTLPPLSKPSSPTHSRKTSLDGSFSSTSLQPMRNYPGTTTPIQTFLDGVSIVPLEVRELIRKMASPREVDRPTAKEVLLELDRLAQKYLEE